MTAIRDLNCASVDRWPSKEPIRWEVWRMTAFKASEVETLVVGVELPGRGLLDAEESGRGGGDEDDEEDEEGEEERVAEGVWV